MVHYTRTFSAIAEDGKSVTVCTFIPEGQERWSTLTYLVATYPQLDGWSWESDGTWTWGQKRGE